MEEGDAITLEDGELTIQIRRAPPKVNKMININEYSKWLVFNPRKGGGHISLPQAVRKERPGEKENSETRWAFFLVAKLTLSNIWRSLMSVSSSGQFCSLTNQQLSLLYHSSNLISDKETFIIIIIRVTTSSENKFSKGEGTLFFWTTFYIITAIWELPFSNPL